MMDEGKSGIAVRKKWRKYIKWGADDFWDSHGIYLHRSGSYLSFFFSGASLSSALTFFPCCSHSHFHDAPSPYPSFPLFFPRFPFSHIFPFTSFCILLDPLGSLLADLFAAVRPLFFIPSPFFCCISFVSFVEISNYMILFSSQFNSTSN